MLIVIQVNQLGLAAPGSSCLILVVILSPTT
jgi:hypothetical protein